MYFICNWNDYHSCQHQVPQKPPNNTNGTRVLPPFSLGEELILENPQEIIGAACGDQRNVPSSRNLPLSQLPSIKRWSAPKGSELSASKRPKFRGEDLRPIELESSESSESYEHSMTIRSMRSITTYLSMKINLLVHPVHLHSSTFALPVT